MEWIIATQTTGREEIDLFEAPVVDLTVGLLVGLDFVVVGTPTFVVEAGEETHTEGNFNAGVKWRPVVTDHWAAAITPVLGLNVLSSENVFFYLPAQVEYRFGRGAVGVDVGYEFVRNARDIWTTAVYATWRATPSLLVLAEVWGMSRPGVDGEYGGGVGIDWTFRPGLAVLAMAGTGFGSREGPRVEWVGYLGVRWAFALWQPSPGDPRRALARTLSAD